MDDPIDRIVSAYPAIFFRYLSEHVDAAFARSANLSKSFSEPERQNLLGQLRHACCEEGFRWAARDSGISALAPHTEPAGGRYSLIAQQDVYLVRCNIQTHIGPPRPSRFRREWASLNRWLNPVQLDLLCDAPQVSIGRLCGMIVIASDSHLGDLSVPGFVGVGVPRDDLTGWTAIEPIDKILARYHDDTVRKYEAGQEMVQVKDRAVPQIKKMSGDEPE